MSDDAIQDILEKVALYGYYEMEDPAALAWHKEDTLSVEKAAQQIRQYIETEIIDTQISDREVLLGMFEANQDNLTIPEILGVIIGQISSLEEERKKLREPME
jgi:hypothetical protein